MHVRIEDVSLDDAIAAFKRYRHLALDEYERGNRDKAVDRLHVAVRLAARIRELGGNVPF